MVAVNVKLESPLDSENFCMIQKRSLYVPCWRAIGYASMAFLYVMVSIVHWAWSGGLWRHRQSAGRDWTPHWNARGNFQDRFPLPICNYEHDIDTGKLNESGLE